jgi:hypothetical protein
MAAIRHMLNAYTSIPNASQVVKYRKGHFPSPSSLKDPNTRLQFNCNHTAAHQNTPLAGVRILDLTRVLAVSWYM